MNRRVGGFGFGLVLAAAGMTLACVVLPMPGGSVTIRRNDDRVVRSATTIAAAAAGAYLLPKLDTVLDRLEARRRGLPPAESPEYSSAAWRLVDEGADEVVAVLEDPELAAEAKATVDDLEPLRDYVRGAEADALEALERGQATARSPERPVAAVDRGGRADLRLAQRREAGDAGAVEGFLAEIRKIRRRAAASDLQTTFCAISAPGSGRFRIFTASSPERGRDTIAPGKIANLWRGRYVVRVDLDGVSHDERNIDLLSPEVLTLECIRDAAGIGCRQHASILDICEAR